MLLSLAHDLADINLQLFLPVFHGVVGVWEASAGAPGDDYDHDYGQFGKTEVETRGKFCRIIEIANLQAKVWEVRRGGRLSLSRSWPSSNYLESVCQKKNKT